MNFVSIRVGNDPLPVNNGICFQDINGRHGLFICDTVLTGNYIGLFRDSGSNYLTIAEMRAYSELPVDETTSTLSADTMPNNSLINAVRTTNASLQALNLDDSFTTGPLADCYFMIDL